MFALFDSHLFNRLHKIVGNLLGDNAVLPVRGELGDEFTDPSSPSPESTVGTLADQLKIACQETSGLDVHIDAVEVGLHQRNESWESSVCTAIHNVGDGHEIELR